jgi:hypothetical protein
LFTLTCCNNKTDVSNKYTFTISADSAFAITQYPQIDSIAFIPLETDSICLISNTTKILYNNDCYFIFDKKQKKVLIFDQKGNFVNKIDNAGRGPGEYIEITSFDVDNNGNIYTYDNMSKKIIKYTQKTLYKNYITYNLDCYFEEFCVLGDLFLLKNVYESGKISSYLSIYHCDSGEKSTVSVDENTYDDFSIPRYSESYIYRSNNICYTNPRFSKSILKIDTDGNIKKTVYINSIPPTKEFIHNLSSNPLLKYAQNEYLIDIRNIYENNNFITLTIDLSYGKQLIVSKKNGKSFNTGSQTPARLLSWLT